jgi:hypothetical protein
LVRDSVPIGSLSNPAAFESARAHLRAAREAIDATLIAGELLLLHHAFSLIPRGMDARWEVNTSNFISKSLFLYAPEGLLVPHEEALLVFHRGTPPQGSTDSTPKVHLGGPKADFTVQPWIRPTLDATIAAAARAPRASPFPDGPP